MVKTFKLCDLDCANCGLKMENAIKKIKGVNDAKDSFMTQKLTIDADEENFDEILKQSQKVCKRIEPDCKIIF